MKRAARVLPFRCGSQARGATSINQTGPAARSPSALDMTFQEHLGAGAFGRFAIDRPDVLHESSAGHAAGGALRAVLFEWDRAAMSIDLRKAIAGEIKMPLQMLQMDASKPHFVHNVQQRNWTLAKTESPFGLPPQKTIGSPRISLKGYIRTSGGLLESEVQNITRILCEALNYLHQRGIIHRDINPSNILMGRNDILGSIGSLRISDFSHAALMPDPSPTDSATFADQGVGTQGYIAPEILSAQEPHGPKCDVFALGCTVHAMLTNMYLPRCDPGLGVVTNLPEMKSSGRTLIDSFLAVNPRDRPTVAEALQDPWLQES